MNLAEPRIEVAEPDASCCPRLALTPEGNVKLRNYRMLNENLRAYTPTGDVHTSPAKCKLVSRWETCGAVSPPRARILELVRPEDPECEALAAIVRPAPRRGLARPLDEDARRFLQRALLSPSPRLSEPSACSSGETSLADELLAAEAEGGGPRVRAEVSRPAGAAGERERLGRLALAVEEEEPALGATARRLDALLAESRALHRELAGIHEDLQVESARACRCTAAARVLRAETNSLRYLDDIVALMRGDVKKAMRARAWPFAIGQRLATRNYVV